MMKLLVLPGARFTKTVILRERFASLTSACFVAEYRPTSIAERDSPLLRIREPMSFADSSFLNSLDPYPKSFRPFPQNPRASCYVRSNRNNPGRLSGSFRGCLGKQSRRLRDVTRGRVHAKPDAR